MFGVDQQSPHFRDLRNASRLEGKCGPCEFRQACGGSRPRAVVRTGNPFTEDPDCIDVPKAMR
jgi:radical SAM protein with 4Fe4S-binding SPASM domain